MSERGQAERDGARLQPNSGRGTWAKGDATMDLATGLYVVDYKEFSKSFGLSQEVWSKLCTDTMAVNFAAEPWLKVTLGGKLNLAVLDHDWAMALARREV
jgi:hypothetical protein